MPAVEWSSTRKVGDCALIFKLLRLCSVDKQTAALTSLERIHALNPLERESRHLYTDIWL